MRRSRNKLISGKRISKENKEDEKIISKLTERKLDDHEVCKSSKPEEKDVLFHKLT
jgi:hypothetical protein